MKTRFRAIASIALLAVLSSGYADSKCQQQPTPHSTKKVEPAPNPDPAKPPKDKPFPGNVEIVFVISHQENRVVYTYNIGGGNQRGVSEHKHGGETSFSEIVKPEQVIVFAATHSSAPHGWIDIKVYQANNGRVVCKDNNDEEPTASVACTGIVKI